MLALGGVAAAPEAKPAAQVQTAVVTTKRGFDTETLSFKDAQGRASVLSLAPSKSLSYIVNGKSMVSPVKVLSAQGDCLVVDGKRMMTSACKVTLGEDRKEIITAALELFAKTAVVAAKGPPLFVSIVSARGLRDADGLIGQGSSDPYCTCEIVGKKDTKVRTRVIYNNLSPVWGHTAVVPMYALGDRLRFRVWDKDTFSKDDELGHAELELDAADVLPTFEGELKLEDAGEGIEAFLNLRVAVGTELERKRHAALLLVEEALRERDKDSLEAALEAARAAGLEESKIAQVAQVLREEIQRLKTLSAQGRAREMLRAACKKGNIAALEEAIAAAKHAGLATSEYQHAERQLEEERVREAARVFLRKAMQQYEAAKEHGGDSDWPEALQAALKNAEACSLDAESYRRPAQLLEQVSAARRLLAKAEEDCDEASLQRAVQAAKDVSLPPKEYRRAVELLDAKERHRQKQENARRQLLGACDSGSIEALEAALREAKASELPGNDAAVLKATQALNKLKAEKELADAMREATKLLEQFERKGKDSLDLDVAIAVKDRLAKAMASVQKFGWTIVDLVEHDRVRKRIHNLVEDLKGSIRVYCRVRPLSEKETGEGSKGCVRQVDLITVEVSGQKKGDQEEAPDVSKHSYDAVFMPGTQEDIFADCRELVQSVLDGYNVTVFAYGQTGGGKTHTMIGVPGSPDLEGIVPRTINELFCKMKANDEHWKYELKTAVMELYCSQLVDLLPAPKATSPRAPTSPRAAGGSPKAKPKEEPTWTIADKDKIQPLGIREVQGKFVVPDLTWHDCPTAERAREVFDLGQRQRKTALTAMNAESSRSHLLFSMQIYGRSESLKQELSSKIILCDLAGSERLKKSKATGEREKEAIEINKSLSALGGVIDRLTSSAGVGHVPYRDHQLTQVLQDSLGGTAKTLMFLNCSPAESNWDETLNTLRYGTRAKKVTNQAQKGGARAGEEPKSPKKAAGFRELTESEVLPASEEATAGRVAAFERPKAQPVPRLALDHAITAPAAQLAQEAATPVAAQARAAPGTQLAQTPLARLAALEEALLGSAKQGALLPRIAELEDSVTGERGSGTPADRLRVIAESAGLAA